MVIKMAKDLDLFNAQSGATIEESQKFEELLEKVDSEEQQ